MKGNLAPTPRSARHSGEQGVSHEGSGQGVQQVSGGLVVPVEVRYLCGKRPERRPWAIITARTLETLRGDRC
jgi:hypothetical protein